MREIINQQREKNSSGFGSPTGLKKYFESLKKSLLTSSPHLKTYLASISPTFYEHSFLNENYMCSITIPFFVGSFFGKRKLEKRLLIKCCLT